MAMTTLQKLERIHNRGTLYEIAIKNGDRAYLLRYTNKSRHAIMDAIRAHAEKLIALTGATEFTVGKKASDGMTIGDWVVNYTGRTQREAIIAGELTFINDL